MLGMQNMFPDDDGSLSPGAIEAIRHGGSEIVDAEAADLLIDRVSGLMVSVATGGPRINDVDAQYQREIRALRAVLKRLDIFFAVRFSTLWQWHGYWSQHLPTYRDRRAFVVDMFDPVREQLDDKAGASASALSRDVVDAPMGWVGVDAKLARLRKDYGKASDPHDFNAVGLLCVSILQDVGREVFDPILDAVAGQANPGPDDAKARIEAFMGRVAPGSGFTHARALVRNALGQANTAKHRRTADALDAGVACEATILVVGIVRLFADADAGVMDDDIPF